ncbi:MAG TPA: hypothetical protein VNI02_10395 [Blastocatellia bacterium]|jgi:hypothetical protein|nr:hypothetical protein [Blastocatellia bacterium]
MAEDKAAGQAPATTGNESDDNPATMRKAIRLQVTLWIEGEDAPAHNFAESTTQAVRDIISEGSSKHPELKVTIKKIAER